MAWAICFTIPEAALLSGISAWLAYTAEQAGGARRWRLIAALALEFVALGTYQPAAMAFWVVVAALYLRAEWPTRRAIRSLIALGFVWVAAILLSLGVTRLIQLWLQLGSGRATWVPLANVPAKAAWFFGEVLRNVLNFTILQPSLLGAGLAAVVIGVGLVLYFTGPPRERLAKVGLAALLLPLAYAPNLAVAESWATYHTTVALSLLVVLYVLFAVRGFLAHMPGVTSSWRLRVLGAVAL